MRKIVPMERYAPVTGTDKLVAPADGQITTHDFRAGFFSEMTDVNNPFDGCYLAQ